MVAATLFLFRSIYAEVGSALPLNGGTYTLLLNTTGKKIAAGAAVLTILSYVATAVEIALKMAFQYWQQRAEPRPRKIKYLALANAYHGDTLGDVSVGGVERFHAMFRPLLFDTLRAPSPYCYRCPLGLERKTCRIDCAESLVALVKQHHDELAAVVIEPLVQGAAGMVTAPDGVVAGAV